ncbi:uncharacterized protein LOC106477154 isoform X2 [Limulus polyphemus]|uniref:Uncharacterized protein LOC106477154 isoform X2 n=1 Tax=Limulus polyphemus TaxID=6850 RepID=A0ABM1C2T4_LIMPO|nr:uncharacterized protein LOC106477154 isoform X2 [Limulus polyphemus]
MPEMNYGFKIEVEDSYERRHDPNLFFVNINCTDDEGLHSINTTALESPFPNIEELYPDMGENDSAVFENETFPTLDLRTVEISLSSHQPLTRTLSKRRVKDDEIGNSVVYHDCDVNAEEYTLPDIVEGKTIISSTRIGHLSCSNTCTRHAVNDVQPDDLCNKNNKIWVCVPSAKVPWSFLYYNEDYTILLGTVPDIVVQNCTCVCS